MKGYTTHGNIRGQCGHLHKTAGTAEKCQARDSAGARKQGGYSDRYVAIVDDDGLLQKYDGDYPMGEQEPRYFHSADGRPVIFAARRGR